MKLWHKIAIGCVCALLVTTTVGAVYVNNRLNQVFETPSDASDNIDLGINETVKAETSDDTKPLNIALFGVDCRTDDYEGCRTDAMMVMSYMQEQNDLLVTSVARDTYVDIKDYGLDKVNHAFSYGGHHLPFKP